MFDNRLQRITVNIFFVAVVVSIPLSLLGEGTGLIEKGMMLETTQAIKVRSEPPTQKWLFVGQAGAEISELSNGERVTIENIKTIKAPFGVDIWIHIQPTSSEGDSDSGWVYYGKEKNSKNFIIVPPEGQ